jgi:ribosomal protein L11 methyltransferase
VLIEAPAIHAAGGRVLPALRVRPPWEPAAPDETAGAIELVIDPGQAFGTGAHASTRLCLELLLLLRAEMSPPAAVLDVGTGSGVLAIAAGKLGYEPLLGLDNEAESVSAAAENAAVNGMAIATRRFDLRREPLPWIGGGEPAPAGRPVVVLANLLAPLLRDLSAAILTAPAGLVAGGLLAEQLDEAAAQFAAALGLRERARRVEEGWGALWLVAA